eukprot:gb/GEZJ01002744.1/.p1 GENE.gb/GEZJ01002744.1/~~gb/GEZJ01002744.1/.p1  ORF type:complete len:885 (+),score=118.39 gb/GEZJ01002744.1/:821-3475(+)
MLTFIHSYGAFSLADLRTSASTFKGRQIPKHIVASFPKSRLLSELSGSTRCRGDSFPPPNKNKRSKSRPQKTEDLLSSFSISSAIEDFQEKFGKSPPKSNGKARPQSSKSKKSNTSFHQRTLETPLEQQNLDTSLEEQTPGLLREELELFGLLDEEDGVVPPPNAKEILSSSSDINLEKQNDDELRSLTGISQLGLSKDTLRSDGYRRSQMDPRKADPENMKQRLDKVKQRRKRLAAERGEESMKTLLNFVNTTSVSSSSRKLRSEDIPRLERQNLKKAVLFTLKRSRVIDYNEERASAHGCEITVGVEDHLRHIWRVPNVRRPFVALHEAFSRVDNPPCPRCQRRTPPLNMQNIDGICDTCYREIYLESPMGTDVTNGEQFWDKEEVKKEETRALHEVMSIMRAIGSSGNHNNPPPGQKNKSDSTFSDRTQNVALNTNNSLDMTDGTGGAENPPTFAERSFGGQWNIQASDRSLRTINPIRNLVQNIDVKPNPEKRLIRLSVGDPTVYGNLKVSREVVDQFCDVIRSGRGNGYSMSMGSPEARKAVADRYSTAKSPLRADDVVLASGTSGALEIALGCIANEGDNVLLPKPGFPLFRTIAEGYGIECRYYRVNPDKQWEICLEDLPKLVDLRTKAIVVNNPSNPCGSVFSESHIDDLLASASVLRLPIIADEVYADMVFSGTKFTSIASRSNDVPVLALGGISKQFVVPGWRLGWILIHDCHNIFTRGEIRKGIRQLTTRMLVPNTPVQAMVPSLLKEGISNKAFQTVMHELEMNAKFTAEKLSGIEGVRVVEPQGAMYLMAEIDVDRLGLQDDMEFVEELLREESVFVLPGQCFQAERFIRIVFSAPRAMLEEAIDRIEAFCERRIEALASAERSEGVNKSE